MLAIVLGSAIAARPSLLYRICCETAEQQKRQNCVCAMRVTATSTGEQRRLKTEYDSEIVANQQANPPSRAELASLHLWFGFESDVTAARMLAAARASLNWERRSRHALQHWRKTLDSARMNLTTDKGISESELRSNTLHVFNNVLQNIIWHL